MSKKPLLRRTKTLRIRALEIAISQIGVKEHPPNSNWGPKVKQYLAAAGWSSPAPWCAAFVCWCYGQAGRKLTFPNRASVGFFLDWAEKHGTPVKLPMKGDIVCYRFDDDSWPDHIGIVEKTLITRWLGGKFIGFVRTIEGNTAFGNDANGGEVQRRTRWHSRCSYVRLYPKDR